VIEPPGEAEVTASAGAREVGRGSRLVRTAAWAALALVTLWSTSRLRFVDPDFWHEIALAREILRVGHVPSTDQFAYTPTVVPVVHHEWGSGLLFYGVVRAWGKNGLVALRDLSAFTALALVVAAARRRGASWPGIALLAPLVLVPGSASFTTVRAQLLTLVFFALLLLKLESDERGSRRWAWSWPPLHLVWLNLHGGFVAGLGILLLHAGERMLRRLSVRHLLVLGGVIVAIVPLNPFGLDYFSYLARALTLPRTEIREWLPLWRQGEALLLLFAMSISVALYAWWRHDRRAAPGVLVLPATAAAALLHGRHFSLYLLAWLAYVPAAFEGTPAGRFVSDLGRRRPLALAAALLLLGLIFVPGLSVAGLTEATIPHGPRPPGRAGLVYPTGAVAYLGEQRFRGNLMVPFTAGGYVAWKLAPAVRISIDGRFEVAFAPELLREHIRFYNAAPGALEILGRYPTDAILVPVEAPVAGTLRRLTGWRLSYLDDSFAIFARRGVELPALDRRGRIVEGTLP